MCSCILSNNFLLAHSTTDPFFVGVVNAEGVHSTAVKEGQLYETVTLKWCTPRSNAVGNSHEMSCFCFSVFLKIIILYFYLFFSFPIYQYIYFFFHCFKNCSIVPLPLGSLQSMSTTGLLLA